MRKLILWISVLGMLSCTRNPGLVLGVGLGIYAAGHRPVKDARRMFAEAHALHKAGKWWASTELLKDEHPEIFPREKLEWAARMVLEKEAKVESTAIRQMRKEVKEWLEEMRKVKRGMKPLFTF